MTFEQRWILIGIVIFVITLLYMFNQAAHEDQFAKLLEQGTSPEAAACIVYENCEP